MRTTVLLGRDWTELGVVGRATPRPDVALVNSRGAVPKSYHYVDDNEDVVAAAELPDGRLVLACADGHNGEPASRIAVEAVLDRISAGDPLLDAFAAANDAVLAGQARERNRTTLAVVVLAEHEVQWAALGDSTLVLLREGEPPLRLGDPRMHFVGFEMTRDELDERLPRGTLDRRPGDVWVLVTDGLEEFLPRRVRVESVVADCATRTDSAAALADALVEAAFAAGAGDNVAAVVAR